MIVQSQEVCVPDGVNVGGIFGPHTCNGVECFQRFSGIHVDGIVGPQTWGTLLDTGAPC
jgi:peptidoglycan hydrolase-like protein with peptidoglycan-binding domain